MNYHALLIITASVLLVCLFWWRLRHQTALLPNDITAAITNPEQSEQSAGAAEHKDTVAVDKQVLTKLAADVSPAILPALIDVFLKELVTRSKTIESLPHDGSDPRLKVEVHSLKSCARTFGATAFADKAALIEKLIVEQSSDGEIQEQIAQLQSMLPNLLGIFSYYQSTLPEV